MKVGLSEESEYCRYRSWFSQSGLVTPPRGVTLLSRWYESAFLFGSRNKSVGLKSHDKRSLISLTKTLGDDG